MRMLGPSQSSQSFLHTRRKLCSLQGLLHGSPGFIDSGLCFSHSSLGFKGSFFFFLSRGSSSSFLFPSSYCWTSCASGPIAPTTTSTATPLITTSLTLTQKEDSGKTYGSLFL